jgi:DNA-binding transcriptional regulator YiaG
MDSIVILERGTSMSRNKKFDLLSRVKASLSADYDRKAGRLLLPETEVPIPDADVKLIRARLGLTQRQFATLFGLSLSSVRNWEQGTRKPEKPIALLFHLIANDPERVADEVKRLRHAN